MTPPVALAFSPALEQIARGTRPSSRPVLVLEPVLEPVLETAATCQGLLSPCSPPALRP
jgi:hypothetical protein